MFTMVDVFNRRVIINQNHSIVADLINGGLGLGSVGLSNFSLNNFEFKQKVNTTGICSDEKPLFLSNGECVGCDFNVDKDMTVLFGCEKCVGANNKACLFEPDEKIENEKSQNKNLIQHNHKYKLIKIIGSDENLRAVVVENSSNRKKFIVIGGLVDGAVVKSVSVDGEIIVEKDDIVKKLDVEF